MAHVHVNYRSPILMRMLTLFAGFELVGLAHAQQPAPTAAQRQAPANAQQEAVAATQTALSAGQQAQVALQQATAAQMVAASWGEKAAAATVQAAVARQQARALQQQTDAAWKVVDHRRKERKPIHQEEKVARALGANAANAHKIADGAQRGADGLTKRAVAEQGNAAAATQRAQAAGHRHQLAAQHAHALAHKATVEAHKAVTAGLLGKEASVLTSAYVLLSTTNADYHGHKRAAMNSVEAVIRLLDARIMDNGTLQQRANALNQVYYVMAKNAAAGANLGGGKLSDVLSDSQLRQARNLLMNVGLDYFVETKQRGGLGHINTAIREIDKALAAATSDTIRGKEADVLTAAYSLLAGANHDYNGHRAAAMGQVESVLKLLDNHLLASASYQQKVQAMKRQITEGVSSGQAQQQGTVHEAQTVSDAHMIMAGAMIQRVASVTAQRNQSLALMYLTNAQTEIGIALAMR
jgi:hypothetical protein